MHGANRKQRNPPFYDSFCSSISLSMTEKMEHCIYVLVLSVSLKVMKKILIFPHCYGYQNYITVHTTAGKYHDMFMLPFSLMIVCEHFEW
jgi:hypothetical protein